MSLATAIQADQAIAFGTAELAESVTYQPHGGTALTVPALVNRHPLRTEHLAGHPYADRVIEVTVPNGALGITSVIVGQDTVALTLNEGDASPTTLVVTKVLVQDQLAFLLEATR